MNTKFYNLFAISVMTTEIPVDQGWIDYAEKQKYERMKNNTGFVSTNLRVLDDLLDLRKLITEKTDHYIKDYMQYLVDGGTYVTTSWINKHHKLDYAPPHRHGNSILSGVYYLKTPKDSGVIQFHKPDGIEYLSPTFNFIPKESYTYNCDYYSFVPKEGMLIIFPSFLKHLVTSSQAHDIRYSIAFNTFIKGSFGDDVNFIELA